MLSISIANQMETQSNLFPFFAPDLLNSDIFPLLGFFYQNYAVAILIILELPPTWRQNLRLSHGGNQVLRHA